MTSPVQSHRLDPVALIFGTAFVVLGALAYAHDLGWIHAGGRVWAGAGIVAIGFVAVAAVISRVARRSAPPAPGATGAPQPPAEPDPAPRPNP